MHAIPMVGLPSMTKASGGVISGTYGGKTYKLYVPSQYDSSKSYPLYVMLHGCTQDATQFSTGTKMNALSEKKGFLVLCFLLMAALIPRGHKNSSE